MRSAIARTSGKGTLFWKIDWRVCPAIGQNSSTPSRLSRSACPERPSLTPSRYRFDTLSNGIRAASDPANVLPSNTGT